MIFKTTPTHLTQYSVLNGVQYLNISIGASSKKQTASFQKHVQEANGITLIPTTDHQHPDRRLLITDHRLPHVIKLSTHVCPARLFTSPHPLLCVLNEHLAPLLKREGRTIAGPIRSRR
jgi:hypothetical protein